MKIIEKSQKETFVLIKNICYGVQVASLLYAFMSMFYWFCSVAQLKFIKALSVAFEPVYAFVKLFYKQTTVAIDKVDLTGVVVSVMCVLIAVIARIVLDWTIKQETMFHIELEKRRKSEDKIAQLQIQKEYYNEMRKYNKFLVLVNISVAQIKSYLFDATVGQDDLGSIKHQILSELFLLMDDRFVFNKVKLENDSFYLVGDIQETPNCINKIIDSIRNLSRKYSDKNITISYDVSFDTISENASVNDKLKFLQKVIQLNFNNSILTTSLFKTCYEITGKKQMDFTVLGKFQFNIDGISNNYELYSARAKKVNI